MGAGRQGYGGPQAGRPETSMRPFETGARGLGMAAASATNKQARHKPQDSAMKAPNRSEAAPSATLYSLAYIASVGLHGLTRNVAGIPHAKVLPTLPHWALDRRLQPTAQRNSGRRRRG